MSSLRSAERGHRYLHDVEAEEEVFPESAGLDEGGEVLVGGGDDADVDGHGGVRADALDGALGEGAEELDLGGGLDLPDLVEEKGAAVGFLEAPGAAVGGAGEGALFVAEKLGLQKLRGEGGAVHDDELLPGAGREVVQGVGHEFLAGAGLALDEDGGAGRGHLGHEFADLLHRRRLADEAGESLAGAAFLAEGLVLLAEAGVLGFQEALPGGALQEDLHLVEVQGLGDEVPGAPAHRLHRRVHRAVGRHHHRYRRAGELQGGVEQVHPGLPAAEP